MPEEVICLENVDESLGFGYSKVKTVKKVTEQKNTHWNVIKFKWKVSYAEQMISAINIYCSSYQYLVGDEFGMQFKYIDFNTKWTVNLFYVKVEFLPTVKNMLRFAVRLFIKKNAKRTHTFFTFPPNSVHDKINQKFYSNIFGK